MRIGGKIVGVALNAMIQPYGSHYIYCCSIDLEEPFGNSYEVVYFDVFNISSGRVQENRQDCKGHASSMQPSFEHVFKMHDWNDYCKIG